MVLSVVGQNEKKKTKTKEMESFETIVPDGEIRMRGNSYRRTTTYRQTGETYDT